MPSVKNINQVQQVQEKLEKAKSVVLADYKGLSVEKQQELRENIKEADGELTVIKNTLLSLAFKNKNLSLPEEHSPLTGQTITLFSYKDEIAPLKTLYEFAEENKIPTIKFGFLDNLLLEKERVEELAQLPSKNQLQAQLAATLASPLSGAVYVLKANLNKLVITFKEIKKKKESKEVN